VLYTVERVAGRERANDVVNQIRSIVEAEDPDWPLVRAAAQIKVRGGLSYADAFCVATAERHGATLATGDPELLDLADPPCAIESLRAA
jgi:predicted nucleic acid-binding protein